LESFDEFSGETIDDLAIFNLKGFVTLFGLVSEWFDDCGVKLVIARNKTPKLTL
jgi:hypothetical protein